jgi:hypothetical protein
MFKREFAIAEMAYVIEASQGRRDCRSGMR